jgi:8-oxo-dGTP pyrophosphatase MutT (NUDIX family)
MIGRPKLEQHAGGIVFRRQRGRPQVLIVTAKRSRKRWVLPKGRVRHGERLKVAALREVREEGGVKGRVLEHVGTAAYSARRTRIHVEYYLIEYSGPVLEDSEKRETAWCSIRAAAKKLTHASARRVLLDAEDRLVSLAKTKRAKR